MEKKTYVAPSDFLRFLMPSADSSAPMILLRILLTAICSAIGWGFMIGLLNPSFHDLSR